MSDGAVRSPADVLRLFMSLRRQPSDLSVLLQFWGESTVDDGLHQIMEERAAEFRDAIARALRPWAEAQPEAADGGAEALARRSAEVCLAMVQGWFANTALFGWLTGEEFLDGAERAFRG